ncbi:alpha/beta fold hydrolase [Flavisolibacter tropicus]|uniref:Alpha/beta hydrolase n=1 Tax=Flavisolibacter tropicus TaxID=1492898 RepID=A0A172TYK6_9BACT|nr:alpha/beta fold hydrolase [Flavisolibacter tropicus]ANE52096.1 alpha/beta hydrolase [Flavisolibacter tropicus]
MKTLLLLHGAIGSSAQLEMLKKKLESSYKVYTFNLPGHGGTALPQEFSIPTFANIARTYIRLEGLSSISIVGYSMGGYVAMYLARHYPGFVEKVVTLATKFEWDEAIAAREVKMLQPDVIEQKLPAFAKTLEERHAPEDWKQVLDKTKDMLLGLGKHNELSLEDYTFIRTPVQLLLGDRDKMVGLEETLAVYKQLPNAQLGILPGTPHPIEQVDAELLAFHVRRFIG